MQSRYLVGFLLLEQDHKKRQLAIVKQSTAHSAYTGVVGKHIFEVMAKNVWNKAKNDTLGQKAFYEKNLDKYKSQSQ